MSTGAVPFSPGATVSRAVTGSTANVALSRAASQVVMVQGIASGAISFIKFGISTVEAAVTDTPILPGVVYFFTVPGTTTHMAAIGAGATLYVTCGDVGL